MVGPRHKFLFAAQLRAIRTNTSPGRRQLCQVNPGTSANEAQLSDRFLDWRKAARGPIGKLLPYFRDRVSRLCGLILGNSDFVPNPSISVKDLGCQKRLSLSEHELVTRIFFCETSVAYCNTPITIFAASTILTPFITAPGICLKISTLNSWYSS